MPNFPLGPEWYERAECAAKCRSKKCVADLNAVITKGTTHQIKEYIQTHCPTSVLKCDDLGRTPVHVAAGYGKTEILDWLIATFHCDVNATDLESGWTALHTAIFYGRLACAVLLIEHGATMWIRDREGNTPLDIATLDCAPWVAHLVFSRSTYEMPSVLNAADPSEVYSWGANENFTLGQGNPKSCKLPEPIEFFTKKRILVKQIVMCKFHTVFVTVSGSAYACGHGEGGRLGTGHQEACLEPQPVVSGPGVCFVMATAGVNHTAFVTDSGQLLVCGLNKHCVLGIPSHSDRELIPVRVAGSLKLQRVRGCVAGMCHTAAWTDNGALYTFGTNAGQLGHAKGDLYVNQPRQVSGVYKEDDSIVCVHACDSATVVATKLGTVYLLQNYVCRKIVSKQLDIEKIQVGGGRLDPIALAQVDQRLLAIHKQLKEESLHVLLRKKSGDVLGWNKAHSTLDRCKFDLPQSFLFKDIALCNYGHTALLITNTGQAFLAKYGNWKAPKPAKKSSQSFSSSNHYESCWDMFNSDSVQEFMLEQVSCVFRAHTGVLGPKAKGGAVLQCEPRNFLTEVPTVSESNMQADMQKLWDDVSTNDPVHDVVVSATAPSGSKLISFACHKYILGSRSDFFRKIFIQKETKHHINGDNILNSQHDLNGDALIHQVSTETSELIVENCDPNVLRNVLEFAYCETCQLLHEGFRLPSLVKTSDSSNVKVHWANEVSVDSLNNNTDNFCEVDLDYGNMSAFAVHEQKKERKNKKKSKKVGAQHNRTSNRNFLSEFKILMKKFGFLKSPVFDSVTTQDGVVKLNKYKARVNPHTFSFDRYKFREFHDIKLECLDEEILEAHRCILVARVEFFHSMLLSPWAESKGAPTKVSIPSDVFKYVLDFIYTGSSSVLSAYLSVEMLCEVLAAADQLLLDRLKEIAEVQVASLLTLKNLASVLEFANAFNCVNLKKTCEQFVSHHLPALLNNPHFYSIDYTTLDQLEEPYRAGIRGVFRRVTTPFGSGPNISHILEESKAKMRRSSFEHPSSPTEDQEDSTPSSPQKRKYSFGRKKRKSLSKRASQGGITLSELLSKKEKDVDLLIDRIASSTVQESSNLINFTTVENEKEITSDLLFDEDDNLDADKDVQKSIQVSDIIQNIPSTKKRSKKRVLSLKDIMEYEEAQRQIKPSQNQNDIKTEMKMHKSTSAWNIPTPPVATRTINSQSVAGNSTSPPWDSNPRQVSLGYPDLHATSQSGSSGSTIIPKHKKLSQKQRKKLEQAALKEKSEEISEVTATSPPANVWGTASSPPAMNSKSFWDVMKEQSFSPTSDPTPQAVKAASPQSSYKQVDSPWQQAPIAEKQSSRKSKEEQVEKNSSFRDIIQSEIHHTARSEKRKNKPMHLIQLEDQAMAELKAHYEKTAPFVEGQHFTVERILEHSSKP